MLAALSAAVMSLGAASAASAEVVYDNVPDPQPGNVISYGFEATSSDEFGGRLGLAGSDRQNPEVTVLMSSWGCESGAWNTEDCVTSSGATFSHPITLNLYEVGPGGSVGASIGSFTETFDIPYRPTEHPVCTGGRWSPDGGTTCFNGLAHPITFDLAGEHVLLPDQVIASVAYDTSHSGNAPLGELACFTEPGGCGYDALNVGAETFAPSVGSMPAPDDAYQDSAPANYCDGGTGGSDVFRLDAGCWTGFQPIFRIEADTQPFVVNDDATGPGPAGADCSNPDYSTIQDAVDAAPAGSTILVCAGEYTGGANVTKRLSLLGAQAGVDARDRAIPATDESRITTAGFNVGASDANVDGFLFEDVTAGGGFGLTLSANTGDNRVVNSIFRSNVSGMYLTDEVPGETVVRHNLFDSNNDPGAGGGNGIYADFGVRGARIDDNKFTGNDNSAMVLTAVSERNSDVRFTGNEVTQNRGVVALLTDNLVIADNTITNTDSDGSGAFSAVSLAGGVRGAQITGNRISESSSAVRITNTFDPQPNTDVAVDGNQLTANDYGIRVSDGGYSGVLEAHFNRIVENATAGIANEDAGESADAENNWWGCNAGPADAACDGVSGEVDADPWLMLTLDVSPSTVYTESQATATAALRRNSDAEVVTAGFPDNVAVSFVAPPPTLGTMSPPVAPTEDGRAQSVFTAGATPGNGAIGAVLDGQFAGSLVNVVAPPQGPTGPTGPQGPQGPTGPAGPQGEPGDSGGVAGAVVGKKKRKCKKIRNKQKRKKCFRKQRAKRK